MTSMHIEVYSDTDQVLARDPYPQTPVPLWTARLMDDAGHEIARLSEQYEDRDKTVHVARNVFGHAIMASLPIRILEGV